MIFSNSFAFYDEPAIEFGYNYSKKKIWISFNGYYDEAKLVDRPCTLSISNWVKAESKRSAEERFDHLEKGLGIIDQILQISENGKEFQLLVQTIGFEVVNLRFEGAKIELITGN